MKSTTPECKVSLSTIISRTTITEYLLNLITHATIITYNKLAEDSLTDLRSCNWYQKQVRKI